MKMRKEDIEEITVEELNELLKKVLPKSNLVVPEMVMPFVTIVVSILLMKFNLQPQDILQQANEINKTVVEQFSNWNHIIMGVLYLVLNGGAMHYATKMGMARVSVENEVAREITAVVKETVRARSLALEVEKLQLSGAVPVSKQDVDPLLK